MSNTVDKGNGSAPAVSVSDAADIEALWLDPALGDGIVDVHYHNIPVGKPRDFFRTVADRHIAAAPKSTPTRLRA
jgi:hypothetical protein